MTNAQAHSAAVNFGDAVLYYSACTARGLEISSYLLTLAAFQRGLEVAFHSSSLGKSPRFLGEMANGLTGSLFSIGDGTKTHFFNRTLGDKTSQDASALAQDKNLTKHALARACVRTPEGVVVEARDLKPAADFMSASASRRFVVKPLRGSLSQGVHIDIPAPEVLQLLSRVRGGEFLVEEFISGEELRAYVVGDECVGAALRLHPTVVGNGVDTIAALLARKNHVRKRNVLLGGFPFVFQEDDLAYLRKQGRCPDDVPPEGAVITLSTTKSILAGADSRNVLDLVNDSFRQVAVAGCKALGLPNAGVDIIISDNPAQPGAFVLDANPRAHIGSHSFPSVGDWGGNIVSEAILDWYFPGSRANRRFAKASFDFSSIIEALQSLQADEVKLPVLNADWHHCRLEFPDEAIRDAVWTPLISAGAYARLLNLWNGKTVADVLLSPETQAVLKASRPRIARLSPQIEALLCDRGPGLAG